MDHHTWDPFRAGHRPGVLVTWEYLEQGEMIPKGWGVAYREVNRAVVVVMPIPFNLAYAGYIQVRRWLKVPPFLAKVGEEERLARREAYDRGFSDGAGRSLRLLEKMADALERLEAERCRSRS